MTLNDVLAAIAVALWATAYGWYFSHDLRRWQRRRQDRRAQYARYGRQRQQAGAIWVPHVVAPRPATRGASASRRPFEPLFPVAPELPVPVSVPVPVARERRGPNNVIPFPIRPAHDPRRPKAP